MRMLYPHTIPTENIACDVDAIAIIIILHASA